MRKNKKTGYVSYWTESEEARALARAEQEYGAAIRARLEEEANHGLPLQRLIDLEIPRPAEIRRIKRILAQEAKAKAALDAIRNRGKE